MYCSTAELAQNDSAESKESEKSGFRIVGYYSLNEALEINPSEVPFDQVTYINLLFFNPDSLVNYSLNLSGLSDFVDETHRHDVKVLFQLAGAEVIRIISIFLRIVIDQHLFLTLFIKFWSTIWMG